LEAAFLEKEIGKERLYGITGVPPHPMYSVCKILHQNRNDLYAYNSAWKYMGVQDYIVFRLGFPPVSDYSIASRFMAFDIKKKQWSDEILDAAEINKSKLCDVVCAGQPLGKLYPRIAQRLHLDENVTVTLAGHDQPCGAFGSGAIGNNDAAVSCGTYECISLTGAEPLNTAGSLKYHLNSYCHVIPDKYVTLAFFPAGMTVTWVVGALFGHEKEVCTNDGTDVFEYIYKKAFANPGPTGICMTPHIVGSCNPYWNPEAATAIVGITPSADRFKLFKAAFEGIACELYENFRVLEEAAGAINRVRIFGGNARRELTVRLRSDLCGRTMELMKTKQTVCLGAAMLAGSAGGVFRDHEEAAKAMPGVSGTVSPDSEVKERYVGQMERYRKIYTGLWG